MTSFRPPGETRAYNDKHFNQRPALTTALKTKRYPAFVYTTLFEILTASIKEGKPFSQKPTNRFRINEKQLKK
jgi:hypothetical protein